ncbi:MAG: CBS domain-containing protein [Thermodesulfovibrionales bacterium]|nr:CBS domain-containing protein [Thermodesulfovibrionales bacterium]
MKRNSTVKDIMIDIFDFPHIPYWFTIRQAMEILRRVSSGKEKAVVSDTILIFDEKYNYMGMIRHRDIVFGLEPVLLKKTVWTGPMTEVSRDVTPLSEEMVARMAESLFKEDAKKEAEKQVREIMIVSKVSVSPDDSPAKAAYLMAQHNLPFIPVLENKQKLVGMISMNAVFNWVSAVVLE